jgi:hypothetical protein
MRRRGGRIIIIVYCRSSVARRSQLPLLLQQLLPLLVMTALPLPPLRQSPLN